METQHNFGFHAGNFINPSKLSVYLDKCLETNPHGATLSLFLESN